MTLRHSARCSFLGQSIERRVSAGPESLEFHTCDLGAAHFAVADFALFGQAIGMRSMLLALAIAVTTESCDLFTSTGRGISIRLDASPLAPQVGDTVTFNVLVSATQVSAIVIDFGDSKGDSQSAGGLPTAFVTFQHVYTTVGNYMSRATVSDAAVGDRVVTQQISVSAKDTTQPPVGQRTRRK